MNLLNFIASLDISNQKAVMYLSSESQTQNQKTKSQMMVSLGESKESNTEKIWEEPGFFKDQRVDLTIPKANFPENTLVYVNQGSISQMKDGEAIYLEYVVLGQIMPVANPDPTIDLENYEFKENECLLYVPLYNTENGLFCGLGKRPRYITLRGDKSETFYSYGYDSERSKLLYCSFKQPIPNIFQYTSFKKHRQYLLNEKSTDRLTSSLFLFLSSMLDRKEEFLQYKKSVNLHPIDALYDDLKTLNSNKDFNPAHLDFPTRGSITPLFYAYMKKVAETSNNNLVRNSNAFLASGGKVDSTSKFEWVDSSLEETKEKFQMSY